MSNLLHVISLSRKYFSGYPTGSARQIFHLRLCTVVLMLGLHCATAQQSHKRVGLEEFPFLSSACYARPAGTAGAYTTLAKGVDAIGSNPAGLAEESNGRWISAGFKRSFLSVNSGEISYPFPETHDIYLAASIHYAQFETIRERNTEGVETGKTIAPSNHTLTVSAARQFSQKLKAGATLKLPTEYLGGFEESQWALGWGVDLGIKYYPGTKQFILGAALLNWGRKEVAHLEGGESGDLLPLEGRAGMTYHSLNIPDARFVLEASLPYHNYPYLTGGVVYDISENLAVRAGSRVNSNELKTYFNKYVLSRKTEDITGINALKLAAGLTLGTGPFGLDYAVQYWQILGMVHWVTLKWRV
jgi:hypothetical protein